MTDLQRDRVPQVPSARLAGLLYLIVMAGSAFQFLVRATLVVRGDASATAANIAASEHLYRLGGVAELVALASSIGVAAIFYELLKPISKSGALLAAFFNLASTAIRGAVVLSYYAVLLLLRGGDMPGTLVQQDLQALALLSARLYGLGFDISLFFFACNSAVLGYLFLGAQFVPRLLGVLLVITGLSYLVQIFANFLLPSFGASLFPAFLLPAASALLLVNVWLALFGVNAAKWRAQADASGHRSSP